MKKIVTLKTNRYAYDISNAADYSITVGELIDMLEDMDKDTKVVFSNDNGYTYGYIDDDTVVEENVKTEEDENMEALRDELLDLQCDYEHVPNPEDEDDESMTEQEYQDQREWLFKSYGITEEEYNAYFSK